MNEEDKDQAAAWLWYIRRDGSETGPFTSRIVRRLVSTERLDMSDQVSNDRRDWLFVRDVPEVIPPELRSGGSPVVADAAGSDNLFRYSDLSTLLALLGFLVLIVLGIWQGRGSVQKDPDCAAIPAPGVDWRYCRLDGVSIPGASMPGSNLNSAHMAGSDLSGSDLSSAELDYTDLRGSNLSYAMLKNASVKGANLRDADLTYADLTDADLSFSDLTGASPGGLVLTGAILDNAIWIDGTTCARGSRGRCVPAK